MIAGEWIAEPEIVKGCEKLVEDAGDAVLSWAGYTTSFTVSDVTETISVTTTEEFICSPTNCVNGCAKKKRSLRPPPEPTHLAKLEIRPRTDPTWGSLDMPATGGLDAWAEKVCF